MKTYTSYRLVKSADLNHHGTLFAGRAAELFVESAFTAAACTLGDPKYVVCLNIHGMVFRAPVRSGDVVSFSSRVAYLGRSSITVHTSVFSEKSGTSPVDGFITFVSVDDDGHMRPHGLTLDEPADEAEAEIRRQAFELKLR